MVFVDQVSNGSEGSQRPDKVLSWKIRKSNADGLACRVRIHVLANSRAH